MKHILNNLTETEKNNIREQHSGGMKVMTENFSKLINSKLGDVKPLVNEQTNDCSRLEKMTSGMNPGKGAMAQGYKPEGSMWTEKLSKVVSHTNMYKFNGELVDALKINSKCNPSKKSIDYIVFTKGNEKLIYLGVD